MSNESDIIDSKGIEAGLKFAEDIELSLLFGSRARGHSHDQSDWDIAILFKDNPSGWNNLGIQEEIRHLLSLALSVN
ncbi:MAG: nucleotidyltransferase domain-containing protein [Methylococcales bacterium]|nr:nucleotidyltransferase domain-containing protein [Methylococcales bacterium]